MKFCAWRCKKRMESYVVAKPTGQIENEKHAKYSDKQADGTWILKNCFLL